MTSRKEYQAVFALAFIMAIRMLGLFMILPVLSTHLNEFAGATMPLMGLALGVYGLTQALLQIPFAMLSDRYGRKAIIGVGLSLFAAGSVTAALSHTISGLIIGRALQGAGAVGSTLLAFVADLTREENRTRAMALMGLVIGSSFVVAMIIGPILDAAGGLVGIFWCTAGLAGVAGCLLYAMPRSPVWTAACIEQASLKDILKNRQLWRLDASIFFLHAILTALFIPIPIVLTNVLHWSATVQMIFYPAILIAAFGLMLPPLIVAEKMRRMKPAFLSAIGCLCLALLGMNVFYNHVFMMSALLLIFFAGFNFLEATLPSWASKIAVARHKGATMGFYSTAQFLGIFMGGSVGGWVFEHLGYEGIFSVGAIAAVIWLGVAAGLKPPPAFSTVTLSLDPFISHDNAALTAQFYGIAGVVEVAIIRPERLIIFKIDRDMISASQLRQILERSKLPDTRFSHGGIAGV